MAAAPALLSCGVAGGNVQALQLALQKAGFPPGKIDGRFGPATEAAVMAFQKSHGLLDDGLVDERTVQALQPTSALVQPATMPDITVEIVSKMFPQTHLLPIEHNLPLILDALRKAAITAAPLVLAAIATIRAEAEGFVPLDEYISRFNTSPAGKPFDLYDNRHDLGNRGAPDGAAFKGRGFVQLTGRANYAEFGATLGLPLVNQPELANTPAIAASLLAAFILRVEIPMQRALAAGRLATARELVNGGTYGLDKFADAYRTGMQCLGLSTANLSLAA